ncbi:hypothetical protein AVEN_47908-1 [Araneus ventricosus]|uniref:Uncharacterized protein n=1 Tax=Araneus ventricosus TaxID=182803 RepID=A0A4Y2VB24_ARAVE|nr:hypothetical protein AVEN_109975-1 [Araneus ventricosus]GBO21584.1 hypothetical protein AVEN_47908-1 [Araneus ventricosus]
MLPMVQSVDESSVMKGSSPSIEGGEDSRCLNDRPHESAVNRKSVRRILYDKKVSKTLSSKFNLLTFPLSAEASKHPLHVYLQVQQWLWNDLDTTEWGWLMKDGTE